MFGFFNRKRKNEGHLITNSPSKAIIYQSELDFISQCILDYPDIETGGDLFGFWTYSGFPVVQYAIGPGPNSYRTIAFFKQDKMYLEEIGRELRQMHGLQHIGEWHSHHKLGLATPSGHDTSTVVNAINDCNLRKFFLVIGNIESNETAINGFMYTTEKQRNYDNVGWVLMDGISPIRYDSDKRLSKHLIHEPITQKSKIANLRLTTFENYTHTQPNFAKNSWIASQQGQMELKSIIRSLNPHFEQIKMFLDKETNSNLSLVLFKDGMIFEVLFPFNFPETSMSIKNNKTAHKFTSNVFVVDEVLNYILEITQKN